MDYTALGAMIVAVISSIFAVVQWVVDRHDRRLGISRDEFQALRVTKRGGHDISLKAGALNLLHIGAYTPDEWAGLLDRYTTGEISLPWLDGIDRRSQDGRDPYRP